MLWESAPIGLFVVGLDLRVADCNKCLIRVRLGSRARVRPKARVKDRARAMVMARGRARGTSR